MLHYKDDANFIKCSWGFNTGICAFVPYISKRMGQFCSLTQEQSLVQFIIVWTSFQEIRFKFLCFFLKGARRQGGRLISREDLW